MSLKRANVRHVLFAHIACTSIGVAIECKVPAVLLWGVGWGVRGALSAPVLDANHSKISAGQLQMLVHVRRCLFLLSNNKLLLLSLPRYASRQSCGPKRRKGTNK
eukprot:1154143-Pelagomonas_calceolata.AAC.4